MSTKSVVRAVAAFEKPVATLNTTCSFVDEHPALSKTHAASTPVGFRALIFHRIVHISRSRRPWDPRGSPCCYTIARPAVETEDAPGVLHSRRPSNGSLSDRPLRSGH